MGVTLEFSPADFITPIKDMMGGGSFDLKPGEWTDDTSMALCLADSLISKRGFDHIDQLEHYLRWYEHGYLSSNGSCFDIGNTTRAALEDFKASGGKKKYCGPASNSSASNGSLMRLAPVPLFFASKPEDAIFYSGESSKTTHQAVAAVDSCRYFGGLIVGALHGASKEEILSNVYSPVAGYLERFPLCEEIQQVASGSFKQKSPPEIKGSGYVVNSLEAALWAFYNSETFEEGCLLAVNLGDDADTTGAIFGQLAGAYYGLDAIPYRFHSSLSHKDKIASIASRLFDTASIGDPEPKETTT